MGNDSLYVGGRRNSPKVFPEENKTDKSPKGSDTKGGLDTQVPVRGKVPPPGLPQGLSPEDEDDGTQTKLDYRFDLLPPMALFAVASAMKHGADKGYKPDGWKDISTNSHLNHAMGHIVAFLQGDRKDKHLDHAIIRLMMAYEVYIMYGGEGCE